MSPEKLAYMANQVGKFFAHQGEEKAPASIADHFRKFWAPALCATAFAHLDAGGQGFDPLVKQAIQILKDQNLRSDNSR